MEERRGENPLILLFETLFHLIIEFFSCAYNVFDEKPQTESVELIATNSWLTNQVHI